MIFISHRGNVDGRSLGENSPALIDVALGLGFDVEVDVWVVDGSIFLGHDEPLFEVELVWFVERRRRLWVHCKNVGALEYFSSYGGRFNYFWHESDVVTLTSWGYVWAHSGRQPLRGSIAVLPELGDEDVRGCRGICSDFIVRYRGNFDEV